MTELEEQVREAYMEGWCKGVMEDVRGKYDMEYWADIAYKKWVQKRGEKE